MAESNSGNSATPWLAFLVGMVVVAILVVGFIAINGVPNQETAELDIDAPRIEAPEINLPDTPAPPETNIDLPDVEINTAEPEPAQ